MNPGLQVSYEDKQQRIDQLNVQKMEHLNNFNNMFHEILHLTKQRTQIHYNSVLIELLQKFSTQEEKVAQLTALTETKQKQVLSIGQISLDNENKIRT